MELHLLITGVLCVLLSSYAEGHIEGHSFRGSNDVVNRSLTVSPNKRTITVEVSGPISSNEIEDIDSSRRKRDTGRCKVPDKMERSELHCKVFTSKVTCSQRCLFGYTLKTGIRREMKCNMDTGHWTPYRNFEDCRPFVDCTVNLDPGGKMKCTDHFVERGPECRISCDHYEGHRRTGEHVFRCDIHGQWHPRLPFCAHPGTGIFTVTAPAHLPETPNFRLRSRFENQLNLRMLNQSRIRIPDHPRSRMRNNKLRRLRIRNQLRTRRPNHSKPGMPSRSKLRMQSLSKWRMQNRI